MIKNASKAKARSLLKRLYGTSRGLFCVCEITALSEFLLCSDLMSVRQNIKTARPSVKTSGLKTSPTKTYDPLLVAAVDRSEVRVILP